MKNFVTGSGPGTSLYMLMVACAALASMGALPAQAQIPVPASSQFDVTGFIQEIGRAHV